MKNKGEKIIRDLILDEHFNDNSIHSFVLKVLKRKNRPMTTKEIFDDVSKIKKIGGKTPKKTLNCILQRSKHIKRIRYDYYTLSKF